jgi:hypothetical protein
MTARSPRPTHLKIVAVHAPSTSTSSSAMLDLDAETIQCLDRVLAEHGLVRPAPNFGLLEPLHTVLYTLSAEDIVCGLDFVQRVAQSCRNTWLSGQTPRCLTPVFNWASNVFDGIHTFSCLVNDWRALRKNVCDVQNICDSTATWSTRSVLETVGTTCAAAYNIYEIWTQLRAILCEFTYPLIQPREPPQLPPPLLPVSSRARAYLRGRQSKSRLSAARVGR